MAKAKKADVQKANELATETDLMAASEPAAEAEKATEVTPKEVALPEVEVKPEGLGQETPVPEAGLAQEVRCESPNEVEEKVEETSPVQTEDAGASGSSSGETGTPEKKNPDQPHSQPLMSLEELAQQFRVPGWQHAALCKLMGWQPGKAVTLAEYETGLAALSGRRLGSSGR